MRLAVLLAAAFVRRLRFRHRWRYQYLLLGSLPVSGLLPDELQSVLIRLCVLEANRPRYQLHAREVEPEPSAFED